MIVTNHNSHVSSVYVMCIYIYVYYTHVEHIDSRLGPIHLLGNGRTGSRDDYLEGQLEVGV